MFSLTVMLPEKVSVDLRVLPRGCFLDLWLGGGGRVLLAGLAMSTSLWSPTTGQQQTACFRNQMSTCMHTPRPHIQTHTCPTRPQS